MVLSALEDLILKVLAQRVVQDYYATADYLVEEMLKDEIDNSKERIKKALYDSTDKKEVYNLLTKEVRMMGPASASELLTCVFPNECGIWNKKAG